MPHSQHRIEVQNVYFGGSQQLVAKLFEQDEAGRRPDVVALQEVWPDPVAGLANSRLTQSRSDIAAIVAAAGYEAHIPSSSLDLMFATAVGNIVHGTAEYPIDTRTARFLCGLGERALWRPAGLHTIATSLNEEWNLDLSNLHRVPPPVQLLSRAEARHTVDLLRRHYPAPGSDDRRLTMVVGDFNHWLGPGKHDRRLIDELGYKALVPEGASTCFVEKTHPTVARLMRKLGIRNPQLDAAYLLAPAGYEVVDCATTDSSSLKAWQIGYTLELKEVADTDHTGLGISIYTPRSTP